MGKFVSLKRNSGRSTKTARIENGKPVLDGNNVPIMDEIPVYLYELAYYTPESADDLRKPVKTVYTEDERNRIIASGHTWEEI